MARHLLQRHKGDEKRAAYAWLHGHNLFPGEIDDEKLNHDYVKRYEQFNLKNPVRPPRKMIKSEPIAARFSDKLKQWLKEREKLDTTPQQDKNFIPDPGRQRDDSLHEQPTGAQLVRQYVKERSKK